MIITCIECRSCCPPEKEINILFYACVVGGRKTTLTIYHNCRLLIVPSTVPIDSSKLFPVLPRHRWPLAQWNCTKHLAGEVCNPGPRELAVSLCSWGFWSRKHNKTRSMDLKYLTLWLCVASFCCRDASLDAESQICGPGVFVNREQRKGYFGWWECVGKYKFYP